MAVDLVIVGSLCDKNRSLAEESARDRFYPQTLTARSRLFVVAVSVGLVKVELQVAAHI